MTWDRRDVRPGRARTRAIRALAAAAGRRSLVAARPLPDPPAGGSPASAGRTVYPAGIDRGRPSWVEGRARRPFDECLGDARLAAVLPAGRAAHLVRRFPESQSRLGDGSGLLYGGRQREDVLAMVYLAVGQETPALVPAPGGLAWIAELGEETALDLACAELDRAARLVLDDDHTTVWQRLDTALNVGAWHEDGRIGKESVRLRRSAATLPAGRPFTGVRQILDAVLVVGEDGHAPGTRVRLPDGRLGTIVGVHWGQCGPPERYDVHPDGARTVLPFGPHTLMVLADQELLPGTGVAVTIR